MQREQPRSTPAETKPGCEDELWLLGQPTLRDYLEFVKDTVVGGASADPAALAGEWRSANDYYHELEQREVGIADKVEFRDLDPALASLAAKVAADPRYRLTFDVVPTSFGMVELDRLVVSQKQVSLNLVENLERQLGPSPDLVTLFHFCLPLGRPDAPVDIRRVGSRRFVFRSDSQDVRFHESVLLRPDQVRDYNTFGPIAGVVGLVVGFGSNFLNAIRVGKRLLLHDGYHRACALRKLGITHAPCIIQTIAHPDELDIVAKRRVAEDPEFYFHTARPPLLRDFFDPKIVKVLQVQKLVRMIELSYEVRDYLVPE